MHPVVNLLPGANLHPGANCAHEHGLRNESIACRPRSLNFVDKLLREVLDFCAAHLLPLLKLAKLQSTSFYQAKYSFVHILYKTGSRRMFNMFL